MNELKIAKRMTSLEIAEMAGKQHRHVRADIEKMIRNMGAGASEFSENVPMEIEERQVSGQMAVVWYLDEAWSMLLVSGYNVRYRAVFIKYWHDDTVAIDKPMSQMDMIARSSADLARIAQTAADLERAQVRHGKVLTDHDVEIQRLKKENAALKLRVTKYDTPAGCISRGDAKRLAARGIDIQPFEKMLDSAEVEHVIRPSSAFQVGQERASWDW